MLGERKGGDHRAARNAILTVPTHGLGIFNPARLRNFIPALTWAKSDDQVRAIGADLLRLLTRTGFQSTRLEFKPMKPIASVCALGAR
jgi:hypothetical protein